MSNQDRQLRFVKMSGAGNDFVLVDNRASVVAEKGKPSLAQRVCRRRVGVGADGLILIENPADDEADYRMRYFNADGSEGELCGNGTRCVAVFARELGVAGVRQTIATPAGVVSAEIVSPGSNGTASVRVEMVEPGPVRRMTLTDLPDGDADAFALEVGVPHIVEVVLDLDAVDVERRGRAICHHAALPKGANANFIALDEAAGEIRLRTFERGVNAETLACGTGATAAATVAHQFLDWPASATVRVASGDTLHLDLTGDTPLMEGPATHIYEGTLPLPP